MLHLLKIQLALTLILKTMAEYTDVPRIKKCPEKLEDPCKCLKSSDGKEVIVKCIYPVIRDYRSPPLQATSASPIKSLNKQVICALFIENGHFNTFDRSIGDYIKAPIVVMRNTAIIENFDMFGSFRGMEDYLYALVLRNVAMNNATSIYYVLGFRQFRIFHLEECSSSPMYSPLNETTLISRLPKTVCEIVIKGCRLNALKYHAFINYKGLRKLDLSHNRLNSVGRSNFLRPATDLVSYDISYNPVKYLPDDMFVEMPALRIVRLKGTSLAALNYYTFQPVLNQLDWLEVTDIPLTCDCEASWLTVNLKLWKKTQNDTVRCSHPDAIRHHELASLEPLDLCISCDKVMLEKTTLTSKLSVTNSTTEISYSSNTDIDKEKSTAINSKTKKPKRKGVSPSDQWPDLRCYIGYQRYQRECHLYCVQHKMFRGYCISGRCICEMRP